MLKKINMSNKNINLGINRIGSDGYTLYSNIKEGDWHI
jgi:hypothetical protein